MSTLGKCSLGFATALSAVVAFTVPATATDNGFQHSNNCVETDVPIDFRDDDIGLLVDLVFDICGRMPTTELIHGNYRRISNQPNPAPAFPDADPPLESAGNARLDAVVFDSDFTNSKSCKVGGNTIKVSPKCIEAQIGVLFEPGITLSATLSSDGDIVTIEDTTEATGGGSFPFAGQLVDAGSGVGGFDCVILIKKGVPKVADIICDMNMWYTDDTFNTDGSDHIVYGLRDYDFGQPVNRRILMWMMGPNPTGSMVVTNAFCDAVNADGAVPERNFDGDLSLTQDPSDYALGRSALREETSISASADYIRVYGEPAAPFNLLSCFGTVAYCDVTEPSPDPDAIPAQVSGNACNRNFGSAAPPEFSFNQTLPGNPGSTSTQGGGESYFDLTNPFGF